MACQNDSCFSVSWRPMKMFSSKFSRTIFSSKFSRTLIVLMAFLLPACQNTSEPPLSSNKGVQESYSLHEDSKESPKLDQEENPKTLQETLIPVSFQLSTMDKYLDIFAELDCPDCPNSIGQILIRQKSKQGEQTLVRTTNCQGSLIGEDLFLTSRHCLPPEIQNIGDSCQENILVVLPRISDKFPLKTLDCDHLVGLSNTYDGLREKEIQPDWAILKLSESLPERFLEPTVEGIEDKEKVFGFLPLENPKTGEVTITTIQCHGIQKSLWLPEFQNTQSALAFLECDRKITQGFSGTILFRLEPNNGYTPVATLSHIQLTKNTSNANSLSSEENVQRSFSKYTFATQTTCIPLDEPDKPDLCHFNPNQKSLLEQQLFINSLKEAKTEIDGILSSLVQDKNQPIQWERVHLENWETLPESYLSFFYESFENMSSSEELKIHFMQSLVPIYAQCLRPGFINNQHPRSKIPIQVPTIRVSIRTDKYYRVLTEYEITYTEAYLAPQGKTNSFDDPNFIIRSNSEPAPYSPSKNVLAEGQFHHLSQTLPTCI